MLAIIGGSGLYTLGSEFELDQRINCSTPYGDLSSDILIGDWMQNRVAFLSRHGADHQIPPHRINYRANVWALRAQGVKQVIAVNAVGGISTHLPPRTLVMPDQIVDYSSGREGTFFDGEDGNVQHVDFSSPYHEGLRRDILKTADEAGISLVDGGTYACTNGPRLETAAEIRRLHNDGCDMVGMTGMPEASLAREMGIAYACVCMVVNPAAGLGQLPISLEMMRDILRSEASVVRALLQTLVASHLPG